MKLILVSLCLFLFTTVNSDPHDQVLKWWESISVSKPLKCKLNPDLKQDFHPIAQKFLNETQRTKLIHTRLCGPNEPRNYKLKGAKIINGTIEGTAKLTFINVNDAQGQEDIRSGDNRTCIDRGVYQSKYPSEVIGTFQKGILVGNVKLKFSDGTSAISEFVNGSMKGLNRVWNNQGNLTNLFYSDIKPKGFSWHVEQSYLIYQYNSFIAADEEILSVAIPFNKSEEILVGTYNYALGILDNVHSAEIQIEFNSDFCILNLTWKPKDKKSFKFLFSAKKSLKIPIIYQTEPNCKGNGANEKDTAEEQYKAWNDYMNGFDEHPVINLFHLKPELTNVDESSEPLIRDLILGSSDNNQLYANFSVWNGPMQKWIVQSGSIDTNGRLHGFVSLTLAQGSVGQAGRPDFLDWSPKQIFVKFHHGIPHGLTIILTYKGQAIFTFLRNGVLHGPVYVSGQVSVMDMEKRGFHLGSSRNYGRVNLNDLRAHGGVGFIGRLKNGKLNGHFWLGMLHGAYLHGKVDSMGQLSGNLAYIYPDGTTSFKGTFEDKFMKSARNVDVLKYACDENGMLVIQEFTEPLSDHIFKYEPSTNETFGGGLPLHIRDPYEVKTVHLAPSAIPNSGEGVFLIRDVPKNQFASLYSLFLYQVPTQSGLYDQACSYNTSKSQDYRRHCKKYSLGIASYSGVIDLPPELDVNPLPNLGPKVNHHFRKQNAAYMEIEHPRYGLIQSVTVLRDMKAGEELFTNYGYGKSDFPADFLWYWETKMALEREERLEAELKEEKKKKQKKEQKKKKKSKKNTFKTLKP